MNNGFYIVTLDDRKYAVCWANHLFYIEPLFTTRTILSKLVDLSVVWDRLKNREGHWQRARIMVPA